MRVGKLFGLGAILGEQQEADTLLQQLVFHLHAPVFQPGFIALLASFITFAKDTLEHRPEGFGERVEIECNGHFVCPKSCRNPWSNAR